MFVQLKEFPDYAVTDEGEVISLVFRNNKTSKPRWQVLRQHPSGSYPGVTLYANKKPRTVTIHTLVMLAFCGPRPDGYEVNHKNGIRTDNRLDNLEYVTPQQNTEHAYSLGLSKQGEKHWKAKLSEEQVNQLRRLKGRMTQKEAAELFGLSQSQVSKIWRGVAYRVTR